MKKIHQLAFSTVALVLSTPFIQAQEEQLIFSERFTNLTGSGLSLSDRGFTGLLFDPLHADPSKPVDVTINDGHPHATNVAVGLGGVETCFCEDDEGLLYMWGGNKEMQVLLMTEMAAVDRSQMELSRVVWYSSSSQPTPDYDFRVVVRIDGVHYASANAVNRSGEAATEWERHEFTFTTEGSDWVILTADVNENWDLDTETLSGSLPDGDIEAVGFYVLRRQGGDGSVLLDEVEFYAVEASNGGGSDWHGYAVDEDGWADTGDWLGWVNVAQDPWISILSLDNWAYVGDDTGWMYVLK